MSETKNQGWSAVISPKSMTRLNTPLVEYFRQRLTEERGAEDAEKVIRQEYVVMARLDEGEAQTPLEHDLKNYLYPVYGLFEGMTLLGYEPKYTHDLLVRLWDEVPESLKKRPS